nr:hypothetical protein [Paracoccus saliphilus]
MTITDARKSPRLRGNPLLTETQAYNDAARHRANSAYHLRDLAKEAGIKTVHQYLMGRTSKETCAPVPLDEAEGSDFFMTKDTLEDSTTRTRPHVETSTNSSFEIDCLDFARMVIHGLENLDKADLLARLQDYEARTIRDISRARDELRAQATLEKPFRLRLHGNDDANWGLAFQTLEDARAFSNELEAEATYSFVTNRMVFTN